MNLRSSARLLDRMDKSQVNNRVLRWMLRWRLVLMVFFLCLFILEGRIDMREQVYRPERGPRQHVGVEFGVIQAARFPSKFI